MQLEVGAVAVVEITPTAGFEIDAVIVNGTALSPVDGVYSFTVSTGVNTVSVTFSEAVVVQPVVSLAFEGAAVFAEDTGAHKVVASLAGFPAGEATLTWTLAGDPIVNSNPVENEPLSRWIVALNAGTATVAVTATVGSVSASAALDVVVTPDYASYTAITTPAQFMALSSQGGAITGKYMLGANLDFGGAVLNGRANSTAFNGVLDGRGYTVRNFTIRNDSANEPQQASGIFHTVGGIVRNIHLSGTLDDNGFCGLLAKELSGPGAMVKDVLVEYTSLRANTDWTWGRDGGIVSTLQTGSVIKNSIANRIAAPDMTALPFAAYLFATPATITNSYTNVAEQDGSGNDQVSPFDPSGAANLPKLTANTYGIDFAAAPASTYDLDPAIWILADNAMPTLVHADDDFAYLTPEVRITAPATYLDVGGTLDITAELLYAEDSGITWSFASSDEELATVVQDDAGPAEAVVNGLAAGSVEITATALKGEQSYQGVLTLAVEGGQVIEEPADAIEVGTPEELGGVFDNSAAYATRNVYLTADVDMSDYETPLFMAGEYSGIFEGAGHTISGLSRNLFNIIAATGVVRNLNLDVSATVSGSGALAWGNNGTISYLHVAAAVDADINTWGGVVLVNTAGTVKKSHVDFTIGSAIANTIYSIAQNGAGNILDCTYSVTVLAGGAENAVIAAGGTRIS